MQWANRTRACMFLAVGGWLCCTSGGSRLAMEWQACWMLAGTSGASCGKSGAPVSGLIIGSGNPGSPWLRMQCASCRITVMPCSVPPACEPPCEPLAPAVLHAAAPPATQLLIRISAIVRFIGPPFDRASPTLLRPPRRNIPRQRESAHPPRGTRRPRQGGGTRGGGQLCPPSTHTGTAQGRSPALFISSAIRVRPPLSRTDCDRGNTCTPAPPLRREAPDRSPGACGVRGWRGSWPRSGGELRLITTLTSFATATDISLAELHLEAFLPADEVTAGYLRERALAGEAGPAAGLPGR